MRERVYNEDELNLLSKYRALHEEGNSFSAKDI